MDDLLGRAFTAVLRATYHATIVAFLVFLIDSILRHRIAPRYRHALWLLVVVRLLLPVAPGSPLSLMNLVDSPFGHAARIDDRGTPTLRVAITDQAGFQSEGRPSGATRAHPPPTGSEPSVSILPALRRSAALFWAGVVVVLFTGLLWNSWRFTRRIRTIPSATDPRFVELLETCRRLVGLRRRPPLIVVPDLPSPAVAGLFRPVLLLPEKVARHCSDGELRMIVLHELVHIRRGDIAVNWAVTLLGIVHWFNPVLWLAFSRMRAERELACDERVLELARTHGARDYGRAILRVMELTGPQSLSAYREPAGLAGLVEMFDLRRSLEERMSMILETTQRKRRLPGRVVAAIALALALVGLTNAVEPEPKPDRSPRLYYSDEPENAKKATLAPRVPPAPPVDPALPETGPDPIEIQVTMFTGSKDVLRKAFVDAATLEQLYMPSMDLPGEGINAGAVRAASPPQESVPVPETRAQQVTTKSLPISLFLTSSVDAEYIRRRMQDEERVNVLWSPKTRVPSGQTAMIESATHRPFVVDVNEGKPQVKVIPEGTQFQFHPVLNDDGSIRLDSKVTLTEIVNVETTKVYRSGSIGPVTVQSPEVITTRVQTSADTAQGETLLIHGLDAPPRNGRPKEGVLLMIRAEAAERDDE